MGSAICVRSWERQPRATGKPSGLELMSSSCRFGPNFSCLASGWNGSIGGRPIRMLPV